MIQLEETISVERTPTDVYDYLKNFASCSQWDSTAIEAEKTSDGPIAQGTTFRVVCALPVGSITLAYTIDHLVEDSLIVLTGRCGLFTVVDTISIRATDMGSTVTYNAKFQFSALLSRLGKYMEPSLQRMGKSSIQDGLKQALDDNFATPELSVGTIVANKLILPGVARFSRSGYRRGARRWSPVSANLAGKHVVLTGATAGLGLATAHQLASMGANLVLVARNQEKAADLVQKLKEDTGNPHISFELADLSLMADVDALVASLLEKNVPIDVIINNAGALFNQRRETEEGLEQSFALLLLSPYRLVNGIKPLLGRGSRVINVVSGGMYSQRLEVDALHSSALPYKGASAYALAKRALVVLTEQWAQSWSEEGVVVNSMHPGWADTPGVESSLPAFYRLTKSILRTPEQGADTIVWLANATEAGKVSGKLFLDREPQPTHLVKSTRESEDERLRLEQLMDVLGSTAPDDLAAVVLETIVDSSDHLLVS